MSQAAVTAQLRWVVATIREATCRTEAVRTRLLVAAADLVLVAGRTTYDITRALDRLTLTYPFRGTSDLR